ncbi:MAG: polyphosphate polymerase domain-containing protein [Bdellovibrionaceae bacterium]|jgi:hypothetical protein|nr:polyphosphate polymerase domain-containing protein [Pseudobdellovibrionaceae bacterium]
MSARYEFKYLINFEKYFALKQVFSSFLPPDKHSVEAHGYPVLSLYYDTPDFKYFYQKINGNYRHFKLRARTYDDYFQNTRSHIFLEQKIKIGERIAKEKQKVLLPELLSENLWDDFLSDDVQREKAVNLLVPKCYIFYKREAYEGHVKNLHEDSSFKTDDENSTMNLRVTFDLKVSCFSINETIESSKSVFSPADPDCIVMEVKSKSPQLPLSITNILQQYSLNRVHFSKYAMGLNRLRNFE